MDGLDDSVNNEEGVRRTRSGRVVRPASATKAAKKKKKVLVEIEVSDDDDINHAVVDETPEELPEPKEESEIEANLAEIVAVEKVNTVDNDVDENTVENESTEENTVENEAVEENTVENEENTLENEGADGNVLDNEENIQDNPLITPELTNFDIEHSDNTNDNLESHINNQNSEIDNCSNTARFPEEASNIDNELNTFEGAIGNNEKNDEIFSYKNIESNSEIDQQNEESLLGDQDSLSNQDNDTEMETKEETKVELMDCSEDVKEISEGIVCDTQDSVNPEDSLPKQESLDNVGEQADSEMDMAENGGPDTEVISEDELPGVQVAKVPETEEVSDEELPGPKRAELPADTEVVSEDELPSVKKESGKRKISALDYDPGSPTSENESASKKPNIELVESEKEKEEKVVKPKKLPELDKYWKAVNDDPADFTGWTYLLQYVDQENDTEAAREAYDAFLSHYPYCYGYWRKYADYEKRKGNKKRCEEVFERGLKAIPLSVDLWIHYLTYVRATRVEDEEFIRSQYERSLNMCGLEFRSDRLWDSYIKWETEAKRLQHVTAIYDRLLATPTQGYTTHFDNFQEHIASYPPKKVLEVDEFLALRKEVKHILKHDVPVEPDAVKPDAPPGEDDTNEVASSDEETKVIRERIVSIRRKIHKNTINAVTARWVFEEGIKRPYFHVKPLERCQLKNWHDYLDFEILQGEQGRIIVLFERCLIACALYEEFWLKFVHYLNELKDSEMQQKIKDVYERACTIHHLKKPNLHLQWAIFEESVSNFSRAAEILVNLEKSVPNLLQVAYRRINLERRKSDHEKCCQLYEHYINNSKSKIISSNIAIKYARFCHKILKNIDKAVEILNLAITKDLHNARLYLQLIDLSMQKGDIAESEILSYIDSFLEKEGVDVEQKILFAQRKLEFLEDFGLNIESVQKAQEEYQKYLKMGKDNKKKDVSKVDATSVNKKDKNQTLQSSQSNSYGNYGNYSNSSAANSYNQYSGSQQGQYNYSQYGQNDQYQYQNWQYSQGNYGGYNQWGGYGSGYSY